MESYFKNQLDEPSFMSQIHTIIYKLLQFHVDTNRILCYHLATLVQPQHAGCIVVTENSLGIFREQDDLHKWFSGTVGLTV